MAFGHNVSYKLLDRGFIEYIGPHGIVEGPLKKLAEISSFMQSGLIYNYALSIFTFVTLFLSLALFDFQPDLLILFPLLLFFIPLK